MVRCRAMGLLALSTGQMLALSLVALVFIAFALASSFLFPRRNPDFPGDRVGLFSLVSVALLVAMVGAMFVFAVEAQEEEAHGEGAPAATETEATDTHTDGEAEPAPTGDTEAGAQVYEQAACGACHVLEAAGSEGEVGPNLDESQPSFELAVDRVTHGEGAMPAFEGQLSEEQIRDVARFVSESAGG